MSDKSKYRVLCEIWVTLSENNENLPNCFRESGSEPYKHPMTDTAKIYQHTPRGKREKKIPPRHLLLIKVIDPTWHFLSKRERACCVELVHVPERLATVATVRCDAIISACHGLFQIRFQMCYSSIQSRTDSCASLTWGGVGVPARESIICFPLRLLWS